MQTEQGAITGAVAETQANSFCKMCGSLRISILSLDVKYINKSSGRALKHSNSWSYPSWLVCLWFCPLWAPLGHKDRCHGGDH